MEATITRFGRLPTAMKWDELNGYVLGLRDDRWKDKVFRLVREKPITPRSIDSLVADGWKVVEGDYTMTHLSVDGKNGLIEVKESLEGYKRDRDLFHEIVHAIYERTCFSALLVDHWLDIEECYRDLAFVEWVGRKARANVENLRVAIRGFKLRSYIYDRISYLAFVGKDGKSRWRELPVLMD